VSCLFQHRYALSPNVTPDRFTVEGLRKAVAETIDLLASPAGLLVKSLVPRDPTGEFLAVVDQMRPVGGPRTADGVWVTTDGKPRSADRAHRASGSDTDGQSRAVAAVERGFADASARVDMRGAKLLLTGPGVFSVRSRAMIIRDVERLAIASTLIVATVLFLAYRSPVALALGLLPVACGALAGVTAVSLGFGTVHGITLGFGTTLIGEAVDYSIYLFVQAARGSPTGGREWVVGFWPTVRLGVLTSIAGFSALLFLGATRSRATRPLFDHRPHGCGACHTLRDALVAARGVSHSRCIAVRSSSRPCRPTSRATALDRCCPRIGGDRGARCAS
jgi:predicted exporter